MAWVFMAGKLVEQVKSKQIREFEGCISSNSQVRTDVFNILRVLGELHRQKCKSTSLEKMVEWPSNVHAGISKFKSFLAETFHGYPINTSKNILTILCCTSIVDSGNFICKIDYRKPRLLMCRFEFLLFQFR